MLTIFLSEMKSSESSDDALCIPVGMLRIGFRNESGFPKTVFSSGSL